MKHRRNQSVSSDHRPPLNASVVLNQNINQLGDSFISRGSSIGDPLEKPEFIPKDDSANMEIVD